MAWAGFAPSGTVWTSHGDRFVFESVGGDVSGVFNDVKVIGIRGYSVSSLTPASGYILTFDGAQYAPLPPSGGGGLTSHNLLSTTHSDTLVSSPTDGDLVVGSGSSWVKFPKGQSHQFLGINASGTVQWIQEGLDAVFVVTSGSAVNLNTTSRRVVVRKTSGSATQINLPSNPDIGQEITIKDGKGDAYTNNITIVPTGYLIDGNSSLVMINNYQAFTVLFDGTSWDII